LPRQKRLEEYDKDKEDFAELLGEVRAYSDYIFTLEFGQLLSHVDLAQVWISSRILNSFYVCSTSRWTCIVDVCS
jgi:hypothetical protein